MIHDNLYSSIKNIWLFTLFRHITITPREFHQQSNTFTWKPGLLSTGTQKNFHMNPGVTHLEISRLEFFQSELTLHQHSINDTRTVVTGMWQGQATSTPIHVDDTFFPFEEITFTMASTVSARSIHLHGHAIQSLSETKLLSARKQRVCELRDLNAAPPAV